MMREEPKLYDYYFYAADTYGAQKSAILSFPAGQSVQSVFEVVEREASYMSVRNRPPPNITAFNFIKTGP